MTLSELREEISIELEMMESTVRESTSLLNELSAREPTIREKTAAGAFLAQFYGGIENILKRVHRYHNVPIPTGETWHTDIFKRFCTPAYTPFFVLFDESLAVELSPFRKFRHVVYHGYGFQLDWERIKEGLKMVETVHTRFVLSVSNYTAKLNS
ncbi:MAG TPA: hypothetical protein HPP97_13475 [Desulfuromonadales bacterium]|nr:hypothetical protein [Desulfuromonadales bacterium]